MGMVASFPAHITNENKGQKHRLQRADLFNMGMLVPFHPSITLLSNVTPVLAMILC